MPSLATTSQADATGLDPEAVDRRKSADSILTDRQREAVLAGLELGYYETPQRSTCEDVAERLGCSPSTASEPLNRAESKLVRAMLNR